MLTRYVLCPVIWFDNDQCYAPAVHNTAHYMTVIPTGADGKPTSSWCIAQITTDDLTKVTAIKGVSVLPDYPLTTQMSKVTSIDKTAINQALTVNNIDTTIVNTASSYGDLVSNVGKKLDNSFSANTFGAISAPIVSV